MKLVDRKTCLSCEMQAGIQTPLVQTVRGGVCPIHDAKFLEYLKETARIVLGQKLPELKGKGVPNDAPHQ